MVWTEFDSFFLSHLFFCCELALVPYLSPHFAKVFFSCRSKLLNGSLFTLKSEFLKIFNLACLCFATERRRVDLPQQVQHPCRCPDFAAGPGDH